MSRINRGTLAGAHRISTPCIHNLYAV